MDYVPLDRSFAPLAKDRPANVDMGRYGRSYDGWVGWEDILTRRRVVLLAEASSGKTEELRQQARARTKAGEAGFFVRIEDLDGGELSDALDPGEEIRFLAWRDGGNADGWFFLDSVDEARLNGKRFERALKRFVKDIGLAADRARVVISCRASDWRGQQDRKTILELLPPPSALPPTEAALDPDEALLAPIFDDKHQPIRSQITAPDVGEDPDGLFVVQLLPLMREQQTKLAAGAEVSDVEDFLAAIQRLGLDTMAERPGDLLDLASYWRDNGRFGQLAEMTEHAVTKKLAELDPYRKDNGELSPEEARCGAERLAGALTFGRAFTLLATGDEPDPTLAAGALDPELILPEWTAAKRATLVRRGVFAPSTYGRLRFHHRSTQEFLTASWLDRLLAGGLAKSKVWDVLFVERYGVETIAPSLRPTVAWLALKHPDIRDETIRREPVTLIAYGDPQSLPLETRRKLLATWAEHDAQGMITERGIDDRALWLFSDAALASSIRKAWQSARHHLRMDLLTCILEAKISDCADLALAAALDTGARDAFRMLGADALQACQANARLDQLAAHVRAVPEGLSARLAAAFAVDLFPARLDVPAVLDLIARSQAPRRHSMEGVSAYLPHLLSKAEPAAREALVRGLGAAALAPPFAAEHHELNPRYEEIAKVLARPAAEALDQLGDAPTPPELLQVLRAVERSNRASNDVADKALRAAVRGRQHVNRALFWANVAAERARGRNPTSVWQLSFSGGGAIWGDFGEPDVSWLAGDVQAQALLDDRKVALNALIIVLRGQDRFESEAAWLDQLVAADPEMVVELGRYRATRVESLEDRRDRRQSERDHAASESQRQKDRESWRTFRATLAADPAVLSRPANTASWKAGAYRLFDVSNWLSGKKAYEVAKSATAWRDLGPVWGEAVAEAYRDGMMAVWRAEKPERPIYSSENNFSSKYITELVLGGLNIEAAESPTWISRLTDAEAGLAAKHAVYAEQSYPEWLGQLLAQRRSVALPIIKAGLRAEWRAKWGRCELLWEFSRHVANLDPELRDEIARLWRASEPPAREKLKRAVSLFAGATFSPPAARVLTRVAVARFDAHRAAGAEELARLNLAVVIALAPEQGISLLANWLAEPEMPSEVVARTFSELFGRDSAVLPGTIWSRLSLPLIEQVIRLAYRHVPRAGDRDPGEARVMGARDYAQQARDAALTALTARPGPEAYAALRRLAESPNFEISSVRMRELAHGRAEMDAEVEAWSEAQSATFEKTGTAPVKSGADLLRVVEGVLGDIQLSFRKTADSSSRKVLIRAIDETEVQEWLAEQLNHLADHRFYAGRETELAEAKRPDVLVTSNSADVHVAIEVKHGGMKGWSPKRLLYALRAQLAEQYLLPERRRHGVFIVTRHSEKTWRDPVTGVRWHFEDLICWLQAQAEQITANSVGTVSLRVVGLDPVGGGSPTPFRRTPCRGERSA